MVWAILNSVNLHTWQCCMQENFKIGFSWICRMISQKHWTRLRMERGKIRDSLEKFCVLLSSAKLNETQINQTHVDNSDLKTFFWWQWYSANDLKFIVLLHIFLVIILFSIFFRFDFQIDIWGLVVDALMVMTINRIFTGCPEMWKKHK